MWWEKVQQATAPTAAWRELTSKGDLREWGELSTFFRAQLRCPSASLVDPLLQQHSLPFPLNHFPQWFLYCTKLRHKYLLSSICTIFCLLSSIFHGLGTDSSSQEKQSTSPHSLAGPGQCVSVSSPPADHVCAWVLPYPRLTTSGTSMPATQPRKSPPVGTCWHLPDPIHSGVWGYPDGQQAGSLQSQSSVKAASDEFWALHGLCYHSSPGSHMHF